jgi:hypothetical protein
MKLRYRDPHPAGYLARYAPVGRGGFAWPANRVQCGGYTAKGKAVACGEIFDTQAGNPRTRCEKCRLAHQREWFRLRNLRRRKATA